MRCISCHKLSWSTFCSSCKIKLLKPSIIKRQVGSVEVYSFFKYQNIEDLLLTKHTPQGFIIYKALAKMTFRPFIQNFISNDSREIYIIGVDEVVKNGYSHVALLTHQMRYQNVNIIHSKLIAKNRVKYAGKTLEFRLSNPREFIYSGVSNIEAILVDDIITTGLTLQEAKEVLEQNGVVVLFALTLADAKA
ncbi:MAG TPA: ComF family protein [Campylobacterales bacterium]|nr:ComF family protein [Campylobacterales bacterium]HHD80474.1 ComF family protein [Campylobacterales bacterium]HHH51670.1 ComF family protein [Campylobacterales bacterium]